MEPEALALTLPIRRLVEFLLRTGSIDSRFTGFDRALEGARLHRKLQRAAVKEYPDYQAEAALKQDYACAEITYTLEGRADGIFTDTDGMPTIDEIKTTTLPPELITGEQSPEHWAQAQIYAAIYARQNGLSAMRVRLTYFQVDEELEFRFSHDYTADALDAVVTDLLTQYAPWAKRAAEWQRISRASLAALQFPFPSYRPGQRAMIGAVYKICTEGGQLLCQQHGVGGQGDPADARSLFKPGNQLRHVLAHQRLATGDPHGIHPAPGKQSGKAQEFFVGQDILPFQLVHAVRHTVAAAQVAQIGHRQAQIMDLALVTIKHSRPPPGYSGRSFRRSFPPDGSRPVPCPYPRLCTYRRW